MAGASGTLVAGFSLLDVTSVTLPVPVYLIREEHGRSLLVVI